MRLRMLVLICGWTLLGPPGARAEEWQRMAVDPAVTAIEVVATNPTDASQLIAASAHAVYASMDGGEHWKLQLQLPVSTHVTSLAIGGSPAPVMLAATDHGLFGSFDGGVRWSEVARGLGEGAAHSTRVLAPSGRSGLALLGTRDGLFRSADSGRTWSAIPLPPAARDIVDMAIYLHREDQLYVISAQGLFTGDIATGQWRRLLASAPDESHDAPEEVAPATEEPRSHQLTAVALDPQEPSTVYVAGSRGIAKSTDGGTTWEWLTSAGLGSRSIDDLVVQRGAIGALYAAISDGVARYQFETAQWLLLTAGLPSARVHELAVSAEMVWAASDQGLYRLKPAVDEQAQSAMPRALLARIAHEPTIGDVQAMAIRYAEVHPDKIASWRKQARWKALVPKFSLTADTNLTDFRHWDSGSNPDALQRGERDIDWSGSMTWELADLIWSDAQTSIDVRSKLMVELRDDVINEATRTYFERRRLQAALFTQPSKEAPKRLEQELRVQELTAVLDGLTGGDFSKHLTTTSSTTKE